MAFDEFVRPSGLENVAPNLGPSSNFQGAHAVGSANAADTRLYVLIKDVLSEAGRPVFDADHHTNGSLLPSTVK